MKTYRFKQVDAFTSRPLYGNPVAVVLDADDIADYEMQRIANWTNLSETTFVLQPTISGPAYRLRIFTPTHELPFAGHPTIGSCHAVLEAGIVKPKEGRLVQECDAGNLPLRIESAGPERRIWVEAPQAKLIGEHPELSSTLSEVLGTPIAGSPVPTAFRNGPTWLFIRFEKESEVAALKPPKDAETANAELANGQHDTASEVQALLPKIKEMPSAKIAIAYLNKKPSPKGGREIDKGLAELKKLGYIKKVS